MKYDEENIIRQLKQFFATAEYKLSNVFIFDWESDFFCLTSSGYSMEVEVKISRADFKADMKKTQKHFALRNSEKDKVSMPIHSYSGAQRYHDVRIFTPNKFFYCCPEGMISPDEIPDYAGLMYISNMGWQSLKVVKPAKWLHKTKWDLSKTLLSKYYYAYDNLKHEYRLLADAYRRLQQVYDPKGEELDQDIQRQIKKNTELSLFEFEDMP